MDVFYTDWYLTTPNTTANQVSTNHDPPSIFLFSPSFISFFSFFRFFSSFFVLLLSLFSMFPPFYSKGSKSSSSLWAEGEDPLPPPRLRVLPISCFALTDTFPTLAFEAGIGGNSTFVPSYLSLPLLLVPASPKLPSTPV